MSGICGIFPLDGSSASAPDIATMNAILERRGPDGTHVLVEPRVALGHASLATTPEAAIEVLPLTDAASGCTITADARLDNRDELMTSLGLGAEKRTIGDGELILRAYLEWGEDCAARLLGDFAFAIWDPRSAIMLCARDQIGMRQLIYHHDAGRRFIFATEPAAILALPHVDTPLNHERVTDYLSNMEGADLSSTFFRGIHRLPPAHVLTVSRDGLVLRRYWELEPEPLLELESDEAYAGEFRALFVEAVRCRLRSAGPIGAMVSGGVDSNAAAAVAAGLLASEGGGPLPTFSAVSPDEANCRETSAIMAAIRSPGLAPTTISHAALGSLGDELARQSHDSAEPFDGHMVMVRAIYLAAQRSGIKVVLDGIGGDLVVSSDFHLAFLLRKGRIRQAIREARGAALFWGPDVPAWRSMLAGAWQAFAPMPLRALRFWRGRRKADREFSERAAVLAPYLDQAAALRRRRQVQERDFAQDRVDELTRVRPLVHPNLVVGRERYDRVAAACAIEPRDPFLDLRLIRFCLSLPRDQVERDGWPKWILRRAMEGLVPAEVLWRHGKEHVGPEFIRAIFGTPAPLHGGHGEATNERALTLRYENNYLLNWFAYMLGFGWRSGSVANKGLDDDDRKGIEGKAHLLNAQSGCLRRHGEPDEDRHRVSD